MRTVRWLAELKYVLVATSATLYATFIVGADFVAKKTLCTMVDAVCIILDGENRGIIILDGWTESQRDPAVQIS
jgi:hypothetical protein